MFVITMFVLLQNLIDMQEKIVIKRQRNELALLFLLSHNNTRYR